LDGEGKEAYTADGAGVRRLPKVEGSEGPSGTPPHPKRRVGDGLAPDDPCLFEWAWRQGPQGLASDADVDGAGNLAGWEGRDLTRDREAQGTTVQGEEVDFAAFSAKPAEIAEWVSFLFPLVPARERHVGTRTELIEVHVFQVPLGF
jgi:hypothetical protein